MPIKSISMLTNKSVNTPVVTVFNGIKDFSVAQTFDCGQSFRFDKIPNSDNCTNAVGGVISGRYVVLEQLNPDDLRITSHNGDDNPDFLWRYLSLDVDYGMIKQKLAAMGNSALKSAIEIGWGIRILRQQPFETLCSFIISQNNNIPRIKKIIRSLCEEYGEPFTADGRTFHSFPTPEALKDAGVEAIFALKTGFRAKYIYDAACAVVDRRISLDEVAAANTIDASQMLQTIKGVGPKVSSCVLLFGFGKGDVFPSDVWIKRVIEKYFGDGFDPSVFGEHAGIAQQYLFYYERYTGGLK